MIPTKRKLEVAKDLIMVNQMVQNGNGPSFYLSEARQGLGLNQEELGELLGGYSRESVGRWENGGRPGPEAQEDMLELAAELVDPRRMVNIRKVLDE